MIFVFGRHHYQSPVIRLYKKLFQDFKLLHCIQLLQDFTHWPSANSWMVNATLRLKSLPISGLEEWKWQDDIWVSIQSYNVVIVDASFSLNLKYQLQWNCLSARPCSRKRTGNAYKSGQKNTEKNLHLLLKVCRDVEYKHIAFVTRSTEKILVLIINSGDVPQLLLPLKKI